MNLSQTSLKPYKTRFVGRRGCNGSTITLPEILVGRTENDEAWARDNGRNRIRIYPRDDEAKGLDFPQVTIEYSKHFQSTSNHDLKDDDRGTIRNYIIGLLQQEHPQAATNTINPETEKKKATKRKVGVSSKKGKSNKKNKRVGSHHDNNLNINSAHDDETKDHEILSEYEKSDHVPDQKLAERVGRAKGRVELAGSSVPADLIIEIKETALRASIGPWFVWRYCQFVRSLPGPSHSLPAVPFLAGATATALDAVKSPSSAKMAELEDAETQLAQTYKERSDKALKDLQSFPALEEDMALYED